MGGYNSGRWGSHTKKTTVEECRTLNLARLERAGLFRSPPGNAVRGSLQWMNSQTGQATASVGFILERKDNGLVLTLAYSIRDEAIRIPVFIQTTKSHVGGSRYWGACPDCGRQVRKLYVPPGGHRFSCRACLDLTYESSQRAHRFDGLHRLTADALGVPLEAVKALCRRRR
jgi:hypothetical protein